MNIKRTNLLVFYEGRAHAFCPMISLVNRGVRAYFKNSSCRLYGKKYDNLMQDTLWGREPIQYLSTSGAENYILLWFLACVDNYMLAPQKATSYSSTDLVSMKIICPVTGSLGNIAIFEKGTESCLDWWEQRFCFRIIVYTRVCSVTNQEPALQLPRMLIKIREEN